MDEAAARSNAERFLSALGEAVGIADLRFDEHGYCCLGLDDVVLHLEVDSDGEVVVLWANVGTLPEDPASAFVAGLLEANLYGAMRGGATIAARRGGNIVLASRFSLSDSTEAFTDRVRRMADAATNWADRLAAAEAADANSAPGPTDPAAFPMMRV